MSAMMSLAKLRASMVVGDFDFRNNGAPLTALPAILTALNATYTRNSAKNVVQNGALVSLSANQFGTSYDPVAATYGYVPEPAATNLLTYSSVFSDASWTKQLCTIGATPIASPTLALDAYPLVEDTTVNIHRVEKNITVTAGATYSYSVFVKAAGRSYVRLYEDTSVSGAFFNLSSGVVMSTFGGATASIEPVGATGWYRCAIAFTQSGTTGRLRVCPSSDGITINYLGNGASALYLYAAQAETGNRATSYIATTGSTASRSADVLTVPLWINNIKDSQDGSTANWSKANCTCVTSGTAPDGTNTAQLITVTATATTLFYSNDSTKAPSTTVTASVYIKQGNRTTCQLILRNVTTATNFNIGTLTFDTGAIAGSGWSVTNEGNGWFRCTFTQASGITVGDLLRLYVNHYGGTFNAGDTAYFWGAQIEPGSVATAYRRTTSTLESAANANIPGFSSAGYTLVADMRKDSATSIALTPIDMSNQSITDRSQIYVTGNPGAYIAMTASSVAQALVSAVVPSGAARLRLAGSFAANNVLGAYNGTTMTADTSATMPSGLSLIHIGNRYDSAAQANSFIFTAGLIPQALTQAQINGLTQ